MINIVGVPLIAQAMRLTGVLLIVSACRGSPAALAPANPEAAVRTFMNAVKAGSLTGMAEAWGSSRGPASRYMARQELEQRLIVMRTYLAHEQFEVLPPSMESLPVADRRLLQVRLTRKGCTPVVPFTLVRYGEGWLVSEIDLAAAGNPERSCGARRTGRNLEPV